MDCAPVPVCSRGSVRLCPERSRRKIGHSTSNVARNEVHHLTDEFLALARSTSVPKPTIDRRYPHLDPDTPLMPKGSPEIPLNWQGVRIAAAYRY